MTNYFSLVANVTVFIDIAINLVTQRTHYQAQPISITCIPCKLLERIVDTKIYGTSCSNNMLCREQHGFITKRSICTNMLECLNDWTRDLQDDLTYTVL